MVVSCGGSQENEAGVERVFQKSSGLDGVCRGRCVPFVLVLNWSLILFLQFQAFSVDNNGICVNDVQIQLGTSIGA